MLELKLRGFTVRVTFSFFAVVGLTASLGGAVQTQLFTVLLCSFMHELGHILAMCLFGIRPQSITLYAGGMMLPGSGLRCTPLKSCVILSAGPAVNLCAAAVSVSVGCAGGFTAANIALGLFNLLPFRCFDGGRIYSELTCSEPPKALCFIMLLPLTALAVYSCIRGSIPVSLTAAIILILLDGISS